MNTANDVDRPLHEDVRLLASTLGEVIRRLEGEECFAAVESLRQQCRARRLGEAGARSLAELLELVNAWPLAQSAAVARAFTLFFLLINTAEQVHRVRRRRAYQASADRPQPGSFRHTFLALQDAGHDAAAVARLLRELEVRPVLTAHPTEATRRTVLSLQARLAALLLQRPDTPAALGQQLETEVELLWLTSEVRRDRPSVMDEASSVLWYLENRLVEASERVRAGIASGFAAVFGKVEDLPSPVRLGSWVGGDRDGNPFVTPETTLAAARRNSHAMLGIYHERVEALTQRLSLSASMRAVPEELREALDAQAELLPEVWRANSGRDVDEPVRLALTFVSARLAATRSLVAARDAGSAEGDSAAYPAAADLLADLERVDRALAAAGAVRARSELLAPVLDLVRCHGFHGLRLDVREDSSAHTRALTEIGETVGLDLLARDVVERELAGRRPLLAAKLPLSEDTARVARVLDTMAQVQAEAGEAAACTYIVSMTRGADDLLRVLLLAREAGLVDLASEPPRSQVDVVPLFETRGDLEAAPETLRQLLASPAWQRQLAARGQRQEVMLGYSDSAKDAGLLPASWALYQAQEKLTALAQGAGVALSFFHGLGGTVGRGGGSPVYRALNALPAGTVSGSIKTTEQGEVISQKLGLLPIAVRSLEVLVTGTLAATLGDWRESLAPGEEARFRTTLDRLAELALPVFRRLVHEDTRLFRFFLEVTPVRELARVHFGSRPAYRDKGAGTMSGIRAIPWVFGWTQIRLMLPGWLGVGTALTTVLGEPGGRDLLARMATAWPFFDDLLAKVEMVLAKADIEVTRLYASALGGDPALLAELEAEMERARVALLSIRGRDPASGTLLDSQPVLQAAIALRNPYVDPLSLLQVSLLARKRLLDPADPSLAQLDRALGTTLNGVAQGLRNTG